MSLAEASRQYQAALEYDRRVRTLYEDVLTAVDVRDEASAEVDQARAALFDAWMLVKWMPGG